jgi:hypothetical protein
VYDHDDHEAGDGHGIGGNGGGKRKGKERSMPLADASLTRGVDGGSVKMNAFQRKRWQRKYVGDKVDDALKRRCFSLHSPTLQWALVANDEHDVELWAKALQTYQKASAAHETPKDEIDESESSHE